jgi:hypothetical protein
MFVLFLSLVTSLGQALLKSIKSLLDVVAARVELLKLLARSLQQTSSHNTYSTDTHVAESDVLRSNSLVNTTSKDDTLGS